MEGPQFSSLAESKLYREVWGCDVIGMTNMPEAKLAREAELCYASVAMITDYDSWHPDHGEVDVTDIIVVQTNEEVVIFGRQGFEEITGEETEEKSNRILPEHYTVWGATNPRIYR